MHRRTFLFAMTGAAATAFGAGIAQAIPAGWVPLGRRRVNPILDRDVIHVGGSQSYRRLRLKVTGNKLFMYDMKVVYGNGDVEHIPLRFQFNQGSFSRSINLANRPSGNPNRFIRRVEFWYGRPINLQGRAVVHLYGKV